MDLKLPGRSAIKNYVLALSLLILNLILKFLYIGKWDISIDEPFTLWYAQQDLPSIFRMLASENNPPLFFLMIHYWIKLFGISALSVRFLPVIFSSLTVVFIYFIGRKFFNIRIAILASLLFTFSNINLLFAHDARAYSLFTLLTTASFYLFLSLRQESETWKKTGIFLVVVNVLLVYSHFFGFLVIMVQWGCLLFSGTISKTTVKRYLAVSIVVLLLYLPYLGLLISLFTASLGRSWVPGPTITSLYNVLWSFSNVPVVTVIFLAIIFFAFVKYIFLRVSGKTVAGVPVSTRFVILWFFLPYIGMFLISFFLSVFIERYVIFISAGYYLLVAISADYLAFNDKSRRIVAVILAGIMLYSFNPGAGHGRDIQGLVRTIRENKTQGTIVYICPAWIDLQIAYYYDPEGFADYRNTRKLLERDSIFPINSADLINDSTLAGARKVIYLDCWAELVDKENKIGKKISTVFPDVQKSGRFHGYTLYVFSKK